LKQASQPQHRPPKRRAGRRYPPLELVVDFEAENALLRAALARSEGAGVRRDLITQELKHRISNVLAVVQAIARQTFSSADAASVDDFSARLLALSTAQKVLIDSETRAAMMTTVIAEALAPHCADGERCTIKGPDLALGGRRAHALTLALHELATNAGKYGALAVDRGWVEVSWTVTAEQLDFRWSEHGGPPVTAPTRRGFGSQLITRNLSAAFGGKVDLDFKPTGVECRLTAAAAENRDVGAL
jgi:two-component sensor histidine kinase